MQKLSIITAIAVLLISTSASAYDLIMTDDDYFAKRTQVTEMIVHAHYSAHDGGVANVLTKMADRAHAAGLTIQANNYIAHAQNAAAFDLRR